MKIQDRQLGPLLRDFTNLESITVQKTKTVTTDKKVELQATYDQISKFLDGVTDATTCDDINKEKETIKSLDTSN